MDAVLKGRLATIEKQITKLKGSEEKYLTLDASKKTKYALLYLNTKGTVAERDALACKSEEWKQFSNDLVLAEVDFNFEKRRLELAMKAFDAEYLTYKIENSAINRQSSQ